MPQEDFVRGSLKVPGAVDDCVRTAALIKEDYHAIDEIIVLQDSHHVCKHQILTVAVRSIAKL